MKRKKILFLTLIFLFVALISFSFRHKEYKVEIDFESEYYAYLPESAKEFIQKKADKGIKVLTEKNKEPGQLYLNPLYVNYLTMSPDNKRKQEIIPEVFTWDNIDNSKIVKATPSAYSLVSNNYSTKIKNQSTLGICWAFATYSAIESNILITGLSKTEVNFAERQIDYAMADNLIEIKNPYALEGYSLGTGSNFTESSSYLNMGIAPVEESIWGEFDNYYSDRSLSDVLDTDNVNYQVTDYVQYGNISETASEASKKSYRELLKKHIQQYGSLYVATLPPDSSKIGHCYDSTLNMITDDGTCFREDVGYHALAIVGWDDSYEGGAWILKNSWGEYNTPYTYLSYNSLYYDVAGITKVKIRNWDNVYDFTKHSQAITNVNSYTITYKKDPNFSEHLERISFNHITTNGKYKVYVKTPSTSSTLVRTVVTNYPGLSTVELDDILLNESEFTIKIVAESGKLGNEVNAFTSNDKATPYTQVYEFDQNSLAIDEQLIVRNIKTGTRFNYFIYDVYGNNYASDEYVYAINGTVDIKKNLPVLSQGKYYLTLDENFFDVNLSDDLIELDIKLRKTAQLSFSSNENLIIEKVEYEIDNPNVAKIDEFGTITAVGIGNATIQVTINDNIKKTCELTVGPIGSVKSVEISAEETIIYSQLNNKLQLGLQINPSDALYEKITWSSSNEDIATVNANGLVYALSPGVVRIMVDVDSVIDTIELEVKGSTKIDFNESEKRLTLNETFKVIPDLTDIIVDNLNWESLDSTIVTVDNDGIITGNKNGKTKIRLKINNDEYIGEILVFVIDPDTYIDLNIDPNGGTYLNESSYKYTGNSLSEIELKDPVYKTKVTLVYNQNDQVLDFNYEHEFIGWKKNSDGKLLENTYQFGFNNETLSAKWQYKTLELPDISTQNNDQIFVGWYSDPDFTNFVGKNITYIPKEDITLYAYWTNYKTGDVNSDDDVDITDLVILRRHLAEIDSLTGKNLLAADLNHDDSVDITDLIILRKFLAG